MFKILLPGRTRRQILYVYLLQNLADRFVLNSSSALQSRQDILYAAYFLQREFSVINVTSKMSEFRPHLICQHVSAADRTPAMATMTGM